MAGIKFDAESFKLQEGKMAGLTCHAHKKFDLAACIGCHRASTGHAKRPDTLQTGRRVERQDEHQDKPVNLREFGVK